MTCACSFYEYLWFSGQQLVTERATLRCLGEAAGWWEAHHTIAATSRESAGGGTISAIACSPQVTAIRRRTASRLLSAWTYAASWGPAEQSLYRGASLLRTCTATLGDARVQSSCAVQTE